MNLVEVILKEHSKATCSKIVRYVAADEERFAELLKVLINGPYRVTQRASWPLSYCVEAYPFLLNPHFKIILDQLVKDGQHPAVKRNILRLLQFADIPPRYQGRTTTLCFEILQTAHEPVAIKVFAMTVLGNLAKKHPELKQELKIIIEDLWPFASAGFIARAKRVLKQLK